MKHRGSRCWSRSASTRSSGSRSRARRNSFRRRHAVYFLGLAEEAEPNLRGSPGDWLDRLEREHDNFRAALDRLEASGDSETALRLAAALWRFWYLKGHLAEGRRRLESVLSTDERPTAARAKALNGAAVMAVNSGDSEAATLRAEEALALHRKLGDEWGAAYSIFMLGNAEDDDAAAQQLFEESARVFRELGDEHSALLVNRNLAWLYADLGDDQRARALYEDNLRSARATHNDRIEASTLGALAMIALEESRVEDAASMLKSSLRIHASLRDVLDTAVDLCRFAGVLARRESGYGRPPARELRSSRRRGWHQALTGCGDERSNTCRRTRATRRRRCRGGMGGRAQAHRRRSRGARPRLRDRPGRGLRRPWPNLSKGRTDQLREPRRHIPATGS